MPHRPTLLLLLAPLSGVLLSCRGKDEAPAPDTAPFVRIVESPVTDGAGGSIRPAVRLALDRTTATVADRVALTLAATAPARWTVRWPEIGEAIGDFTVAATDNEPAAGQGDAVVQARRLTLEPFLDGRHTIPALEFRFDPPAGSAVSGVTISSEPIEVAIMPIVSGTTVADVGPLHGVVAAPTASDRLDWIITASLLFSAAAAGLITLHVRRRRPPPEVPPSALEAAQTCLRQLEARPLDSLAEVDALYVDLTAALRRYAAARFGLPPADRTSEQLLADLSRADPAARAELSRLLGRIDKMKFAGLDAGDSALQARADLSSAWAFVAANGEAPAAGGGAEPGLAAGGPS